VFEDRALRRIFGPEREGGGDCIMKRFITCNQIKEDEMSGNVVRMGKMRNAYKILVRKPEGKTPRGRPRHRG
jgi:hypothetical protein